LSIVNALAAAEKKPSDATLKSDMDMWSVQLTKVKTQGEPHPAKLLVQYTQNVHIMYANF